MTVQLARTWNDGTKGDDGGSKLVLEDVFLQACCADGMAKATARVIARPGPGGSDGVMGNRLAGKGGEG